jgi:hypothetical protein
MSRRLQSLIVLLGATAALCVSAVATAHQPVASAAARCGVGSGQGYGYAYVTSLIVHGTSCSTGKTIVKHHGKISGWSCTKKRLVTSPVQYLERERCTSGSRRVQWVYTENT